MIKKTLTISFTLFPLVAQSAWLLPSPLHAVSAHAPYAQNSSSQGKTQAQKEQTEKELQQIRQRIEHQTKQFEKNKSQLSSAEKNLQRLEQQIASTQQDVRLAQKQRQQVQAELQQLEHDQEQLIQRVASQLEQLSELIVAAYQTGDLSFLQFLLHIDQSKDFERHFEYYKAFQQAHSKELEQLRVLQTELEELTTQVNAKEQELATQEERLDKQLHTFASQQKQQEQLVQKLHQDVSTQEKSLQQLRDNERELETLLSSLEHIIETSKVELAGLAQFRRKLPWPVQGNIRHRYGDERSGQISWNAMVFNTQANVAVHAIAPGMVMLANWVRGFGMMVVLDHGNGYMSLYGYNQDILVQPGELVRQGDILAYTGQSGGQKEPGLYFAIRFKGNAVNPALYLK